MMFKKVFSLFSKTKLIWLALLMAGTTAHAGVTVRYQHTDALGSVIMETNASGQMIGSRHQYQPFGQGLNGQKTGLGYTGHLEDTDLGLTYMQQRYYDPVIGRFYSNDPVGFTASNPMMFNRYAYGNNNPYKYVDPNGEYVQIALTLRTIVHSELDKAEQIAREELSTKFGHNDLGDATRHATWNYRMMEETLLPSSIIKLIGIAHEVDGMIFRDQPEEEFWMDLNNNDEGINASLEGRNIEKNNLIISAKKGDNNYEKYSGDGNVRGVVQVSGRIESKKLEKQDKEMEKK